LTENATEPDLSIHQSKTWGDKEGWRYGYRNPFEAKIEVMKSSL
jgi:hypothetical protein